MSRRARLLKVIADLRGSYWFVPSCLVLVALALSRLTLAIDANQWWPAPVLASVFDDTQVEGARAIVSVIAQSIIGVTGVMFSVTMVAVSFASGNFGPRLIGNFMRDRGNQWSLGALISTFCYAIVILRSIQSGVEDGPAEFVPQVSLMVAMTLVFLGVFVIIYFVHHIPEIINVGNISASLGKRWCEALGRTAHDADSGPAAGQTGHGTKVALGEDGYVQRVDTDLLEDLAERHGARVALLALPGSFVHRHQPVLEITPEPDEELIGLLRNGFAVGQQKTEDQNLLFLGEQQVEMIARALSPGVNDPFTAMNCLNWLGSGLAHGATLGSRFGIRSTATLEVPALDFEKLVAATFGSALPYILDDAMVTRHLGNLVETLMETDNPDLRQALEPVRARLAETARRDGTARAGRDELSGAR